MRKRFLPGVPVGRAVFKLRSDIGVVGLFFYLFVTGLNVSIGESECVVCRCCYFNNV